MSKRNSRFSIIAAAENVSSIPKSTNIIKEQIVPVSDASTDTDTQSNNQNNSLPVTSFRLTENFIVIWLNLDTTKSNENRNDSITKLCPIINSTKTFTDPDECIDFLSDVQDEEVFMIMSGSPIEQFLFLVEDIANVRFIYIFDDHGINTEQGVQKHKKVKGIFTQIDDICHALKKDVNRLMIDLTPFSILSATSSPNIDELDQSFMYTQLLKEIILEIEHDEKARQDFTDFCFHHCAEQDFQSKTISQFQRYYVNHSAIWWYTKEWFVYSTLNKALRQQDVKVIIKMGFFLQDLHREIARKHSETHLTSKMVVYRGQGMSRIDFDKLKKNKGGLFSFNHFLSTSLDRDVSFAFADSARQNLDIMGILFRMEIDPSISTMPYVSLHDTSNFSAEEEILFSMHTIFRISEINQLDDHLWEVNLISTSDNDSQLKSLVDFMRNETAELNGWARMALLMETMGKFDKALEIGNSLLQSSLKDESEMDDISQTFTSANMGSIYRSMGNYSDALIYLEKLLRKWQNTFPDDSPLFGIIYTNLAAVHQSLGSYTIALSYYEKALTVLKTIFLLDHLLFAQIYQGMALVHYFMSNYTTALLYLEQGLKIGHKLFPSNHPHLAASYNSMALIYQTMSDYTMALSYSQKALAIQQKVLPLNHPDLAATYSNISRVYQLMGNYKTALPYLEKAMEIFQQSLSSTHPYLAMVYNNMALIYQTMSDYTMALSYSQKALAIQQKVLPLNHPDLAATYSNISRVYQLMGNYKTALPYLEKAMEIFQQSLSSTHPYLAMVYNNMAGIYQTMSDYTVALSHYDKALEIQKKTLPSGHPDLMKTYGSIGWVSQLRNDLLTTFSNWEKTVEVQQKYLIANYSSLGFLPQDIEEFNHFSNLGLMGMSQVKKFLQIHQKLFSSNHPQDTWTDDETDEFYQAFQDLRAAFSNLEKWLQYQQKSPIYSHPMFVGAFRNVTEKNAAIENSINMISSIKQAWEINLKRFDSGGLKITTADNDTDQAESSINHISTAFTYYEKTLETVQKNRPPNDPFVATNHNNIGNIFLSIEDYSSALSYFEKALEIMHKSLPNNHPLLSETYSNMAKAFDGLGKYDKAIDYAKQAVTTAYANLGSNDDVIKSYEDQLGRLQRKL